MADLGEDDLRRAAERRADAKLAFRSHLMAYVVVNAGLIAINLVTSPGYYWFIWPLMGWGVGLIAHGMGTFIWTGDSREQMVQKEMERLRQSRR